MTQPIGAFRVHLIDKGNAWIEADGVRSFHDLHRADPFAAGCQVRMKDGTWEDSDEPAEVVVRRYNDLVQAARMRKFSEDEGNTFGLHLNQDCLP